jgi:ceramide glucosyltransferase
VTFVTWALILAAGCGVAQALAGLAALALFARRRPAVPTSRPPVTILKPVCGDEALLEEAIASFCAQSYPEFQMVIGAHAPDDPAVAVARRVAARFPACDISIVIDASRHGANGKISNLMNMLPHARHDVLVIADSDLHVRPDYLDSVVAALAVPGTGLVTTLCGGEAASDGMAGRLGAAHISHTFLPGALLAVALGRRDCLGGTMALRRDVLARAGGLAALVGHLADDNVLGQLVRQLGLSTRLANTLPVVTVQERTVRDIWLHELRWARTIRALAPLVYCCSALQYPLLWALLAVIVSGAAPIACGVFLAAWAARILVAAGIDRAAAPKRARTARATPAWLWPLRDLLSVAEVGASFWSRTVVWRGRTMYADHGIPPRPATAEADLLSMLDQGMVGDDSLAA